MYVVIMGGGRVGLTLAHLLINDGHDVTLIENDESVCGDLAVELDALVICGNGTDTKALEEANIKTADVFVAATGNDEANLLSCILVREYNISKLIARVSNPDHEEAFIKVGIDAVISPERTAAGYLEKLITRPKVADLIVLGHGNAEILDMAVNNKRLIGQKIGDISPTEDYLIVAVYNNDELIIPHSDMVLEKNSKVSVLVKTKAVKRVTELFTS